MSDFCYPGMHEAPDDGGPCAACSATEDEVAEEAEEAEARRARRVLYAWARNLVKSVAVNRVLWDFEGVTGDAAGPWVDLGGEG